jgi:hypothetical protein
MSAVTASATALSASRTGACLIDISPCLSEIFSVISTKGVAKKRRFARALLPRTKSFRMDTYGKPSHLLLFPHKIISKLKYLHENKEKRVGDRKDQCLQ